MKYPLDATFMAIKSCSKFIKAKIMALDFLYFFNNTLTFYYFSSLFRLIGVVVEACLPSTAYIEMPDRKFQSPYYSQVPAFMVIILVLRSSNTSVVDGQAGFGSIHLLEL